MEPKRNKKVIYTAIFGDYNGLAPQPRIPGFDYVCFTDNPHLKADPWQVKVVELPVKQDFTRSNRYYKLLPHRHLSAYDSSVYLDGNMLIVGDLNDMVSRYLKDCNMAAFSHEFTIPDGRDCIYKEYHGILQLAENEGIIKDDPEVMKKFIDKIKAENYPEHNGLIKGTCLLRKHNEPDVIEIMEAWWTTVCEFSKRDQLSFNYLAWKYDFNFATIPGDLRRGNPWVYWIGQHRKNWRFKILKIKLKRALGLIKIPEST